MNFLCNDQLTRVHCPSWADPKTCPLPQTYRVGDKGDKNGMPYTVKAFGCLWLKRHSGRPLCREHPRSVWLLVKYTGDKAHKWDMLMIGDTNSFHEKLVFGGRHPNPVFTHYLPKGHPQPL